MAPVEHKRQRGEEEVRRPKKKIKVKRQTEYHSSSEDDVEDAGVEAQPRDAVSRKSAPHKSILKQSASARIGEEDGKARLENASPEAEGDEVEINTALNAIRDGNGEVDDEDDESASEGIADSVSDEEDEDDASSVLSETPSTTASSTSAARARKKRNDPTAFATSISRILDTKLTAAKRQDPVLSRSKSAAEANKSIADAKVEQTARAQMRAEKKHALEKGRVRDVLGLETDEVDTGAILEAERRLKKTAQRGVVKLFNAVRAAQVRAEESMRQAKSEGMVGMQKREERVNEMSKQGFLDLISSGGKKAHA